MSQSKKSGIKSGNVAALNVPKNDDFMSAGIFKETTLETERSWHNHLMGFLGGIDSGLVSLKLESHSCILQAGTACWVPPGEYHSAIALGLFSGWILHIPTKLCKDLPKSACVLKPTDLLTAGARKVSTWEKGKKLSPDQKRLTSLVIEELKISKQGDFFDLPFPSSETLKVIAEKILKNPTDMLTVEQWAYKVAMSKRTFTRRFSEETGLSFTHWRQRAKVHSAIGRLAKKQSVQDIAFDLGYENVSAFIAMFKKQTGHSPLHFIRHKQQV